MVFDRWDGCMLYGGISVMYVSESVKEQLRPYAGKAVQIDATDVFQPINPGDGLIREFKYLGQAPAGRNWVQLDGLQVTCHPRADKDGIAIVQIIVSNQGKETVKLFRDELCPTLLTRGTAKEWTPFNGPSVAMITRQSFSVGGDEPRWKGKHWTIGEENALPHDFELQPKERKVIDFIMELPDGEYDFLCGYGGHGVGGLSSMPVGFDIEKKEVRVSSGSVFRLSALCFDFATASNVGME